MLNSTRGINVNKPRQQKIIIVSIFLQQNDGFRELEDQWELQRCEYNFTSQLFVVETNYTETSSNVNFCIYVIIEHDPSIKPEYITIGYYANSFSAVSRWGFSVQHLKFDGHLFSKCRTETSQTCY